MRLPWHFGRAKRMAHEQHFLGSAVANLTCRNCGELFVHMQARRLHERFCANIRPEAEGFVYWVCNCEFEVRLSHTASRRDRQTAQHKQHIYHKNCRGGGVVNWVFLEWGHQNQHRTSSVGPCKRKMISHIFFVKGKSFFENARSSFFPHLLCV